MKHFFITITFFFIIVICLIACSNEIESSNNNSPAPTYTVTYSDGVDDAEIKVPVDSSSYHTGDIVSVKFDEIGTRSGYSFLSWSNGNETFSSNGTTSFKMGTSNVSLMAQWKKNPEVKRYSVAIATGIEHGAVTVDKTLAAEGETVTITASPETGYKLQSLIVRGNNNSYVTVTGSSFVMPAQNVSISAIFTVLPPNIYAVTVSGGTANPSVGAQGTLITLTANVPDKGKVFESWNTTNADIIFENINSSNTTFTMPSNNVSINSVYKNINYSVNVASDITHGSLSVDATSAVYGDTITITASPEEGYCLDEVYYYDNMINKHYAGETDNINMRVFQMPDCNVTLNARFVAKDYSISIDSCTNGSIRVSAENAIKGANVKVWINPEDSCELASLSISTETGIEIEKTENVNNIQNNGNFVFTMPAKNIIIKAKFRKYYTFQSTAYREIGTTVINGTTYKLVEFGDYPQTIKADNVTVDELKGAKKSGNLPYYKGSDGAWYAKIEENAFSTGYTYSDGSVVGQGGTDYKWFKVEPIKWRVLTEKYCAYNTGNAKEKKFLLAENILAATRFNDRKGFETFYTSDIHSWLYAFINDSNIVSKLDEDYAPINKQLVYHYGTEPKLSNFLVAVNTVCASKYGFNAKEYYIGDTNGTTSSCRIREATDYAKACGVPLITSSSISGKYWLNDTDMNIAYYVTGSGKIESTDVTEILGVVPAVFVKK